MRAGLAAALVAGFLFGDVAQAGETPFEDAQVSEAVAQAVRQGVDEDLLRVLVEKSARLEAEGFPGLPAGTLLTWIQDTGNLAEEGLPTGPVLSRYLQGLAKGVPTVRIETAVRELEGRLREAAVLVDATCVSPGALRSKERLATIDHTAYALGVEVSTENIRSSLALAASEPNPIGAAQAPVLTLGMLAACGLAEDTSFQVVEIAWRHGYRGDSLGRLGMTLGGANPGGAPPPELVKEVLDLLDRTGSEDRFFEGLDELMGRQGYRLPVMGIEDDPMGRRGDRTRTRTPVDTPRDPGQPQPVVGG